MAIPLIHVSEPDGQGLRQFLELGWAFVLSAAIVFPAILKRIPGVIVVPSDDPEVKHD